jgi:hypothetical protein
MGKLNSKKWKKCQLYKEKMFVALTLVREGRAPQKMVGQKIIIRALEKNF